MDLSFPLTPLQQGMLLQSIDREARSCYVIQTVFAWTELISLPEFESAWQILASRHQVLRSSFQWKGEPPPRQIVTARAAVDFRVVALDDSPADSDLAKGSVEISAFLDDDLKRGFSTFDAPPWRVTVLTGRNGRSTAVWTFHHLLLDGRSHVLLLQELVAIYDGLLEGTAVDFPHEIPQEQHSLWMAQQDFAAGRHFWSEYLHSTPLPAVFPRPSEAAVAPAGYAFYNTSFGPRMASELSQFSASTGISTGNLIQASWALLLGCLANETDVVVGAVRACRRSGIAEADRFIGVMINTVPLRVSWTAAAEVKTVLHALANDWRKIRDYEHTPMREIRRSVAAPANGELFGTVISFSSPHFTEAVFADRESRRSRRLWLRQTTPYCSADVSASPEDVSVSVNVPQALVEPEIARQLPQFLLNTVASVMACADRKIRDISPLDDAGRRKLIFATNTRWEPAPDEIGWIDRISALAAQQGDAIAIESPIESISWRDLEQRSSQLAVALVERGLPPGGLVAVFLPRSTEFVWICLGILRAGGAYLPLDCSWPEARIRTVLEDAQPFETVTSPSLQKLLERVGRDFWIPAFARSDQPLLAPPSVTLTPDSPAYVIYTSGSSGVPKGVEIAHGGLQNLIDDAIETFSLSPADRGSFVSNTAFDASVHEIWPILTAGASLFLPDTNDTRSPAALLHWLADRKISIAFVSVIMAEAILQMANGRSLALRYLLTGGDQLRLRPGADLPFTLVNEYGPTEYTVVATRYAVPPSDQPDDPIAIGKPLRGTRAYVMNSCQQLLPAGVPGELVLAGPGRALGYRNRRELTAERFVPNTIIEEPSARLYRTNDLVRWQEDGNLQFLGRLDSQVKLRGFRIELGEIEACLLKETGVAEAVIVVQRLPEPRLIAFVVLSEPAVAGSSPGSPENGSIKPDLAAHLRNLVPDYMVPSHFVCLPALPVNSSGKYDRKQLEALTVQQSPLSDSNAATWQSPLEEQIATLWKDILAVPVVRPDDRFLSLGGTSLSLINLVCAVDVHFGVEIPVAELFSNPTPGDLARLIESGESQTPRPIVRLRGKGLYKPLFCIPGAGGGIHWFQDVVAAMDPDCPAFGVELLALSQNTQNQFTVSSAADEIAGLIGSLVGRAACCLCGYSGGGLLALAVAQRLESSGTLVERVFLLDTYLPPRSNSQFFKALRWLRGWWSLPLSQRGQALIGRLHWLGHQPPRAELSEKEKSLLAVKQRHIEAFVRHRMEPYAGQASLFFSQDRPLSVRDAIHQDWSRYLSGEFNITILPGDHYSLLRKANAKQLAACFSSPSGRSDRLSLDADSAVVTSGAPMA